MKLEPVISAIIRTMNREYNFTVVERQNNSVVLKFSKNYSFKITVEHVEK